MRFEIDGAVEVTYDFTGEGMLFTIRRSNGEKVEVFITGSDPERLEGEFIGHLVYDHEICNE